jgi:hypothetical protein
LSNPQLALFELDLKVAVSGDVSLPLLQKILHFQRDVLESKVIKLFYLSLM